MKVALLTRTAHRMCRLDRLLRAGLLVRRSVLMEEYGVSLATFKRDLSFLRSQTGAVIVFDRFTNSYRLVNRDWRGVMAKLYEEAAKQ